MFPDTDYVTDNYTMEIESSEERRASQSNDFYPVARGKPREEVQFPRRRGK